MLALLLLGLDVLVRAWRIQLSVWCAGGRLSLGNAIQLNLYGEAASAVTPNRLGGEPARFVGMTESGLRVVTALVGLGVEVAAEWPVFLVMAAGLALYYIPDWESLAARWLRHHLAADLVAIELAVLLVLLAIYLIRKVVRGGTIRHRVKRQWRVAWAHVRRAPWWVMAGNAALTAVSLAARAAILPALAFGMPDAPDFSQMFFGALALLAAPLVVPLPSGGGGIEAAFYGGFAGDFGDRQVGMLVLFRVYSIVILAVVGGYVMIRNLGIKAAKELFSIGYGKRAKP